MLRRYDQLQQRTYVITITFLNRFGIQSFNTYQLSNMSDNRQRIINYVSIDT